MSCSAYLRAINMFNHFVIQLGFSIAGFTSLGVAAEMIFYNMRLLDGYSNENESEPQKTKVK